ncbi:ABC transporter permease [Bacillus tianshenii]|uniref:FtsX-like permease family protein n=1 Tax=Sutcliffiella tianshenii TaxID=1463404 RepID=UPI001CD33F93|nr:FtsX-like permease family protein [Bacillus tianshenii]MCA1318289.1 ABC transporter permease [Bacillus tianshenii]
MTFNQLVWKMAKRNKGKYIFYYLCNSFAVMFFFMYATVYFNERIVEVKELESIQDALAIPGVALIVFTAFFINYAHRIFTRRRRKEFGLLMTLGMSNRDIVRLLLVENGVIAAASIASGLLAGTVFSRLFFLVLMNSAGMGQVPFHLSYEMFGYSIAAFMIVFFISVGITLYLTLFRSLSDSLKSDRVADRLKLRSPLLGGFGIALVILSAWMLYFNYLNNSNPGGDGMVLLVWTIALLIGLYIALSQSMSFFIEMAKKYKTFYYRKLLFLTSLEYKFKQLTAILMLVTVMGMVTIFYTTLLLFIYSGTEKQVVDRHPYDIAFVETKTKNVLSEEELFSLLDKEGNPVKEHIAIELFDYYEQDATWEEIVNRYTFMKISDFNQLTKRDKKVVAGEYIYFHNQMLEYAGGINIFENGLSLDKRQITLSFKEKIVEKKFNSLNYDFSEFLVVNDTEFDKLKRSLAMEESVIHLINVENWKDSSTAVEDLTQKLNRRNNSTLPYDNEHYSYESEEELFRPSSKIADYNYQRNSGGIMFFVSTFISVLFFFGSFILLYLNVFSNIEQDKEKYRKLYKIGITKKEIQRLIAGELKVLFFFAPLLGTAIAFHYIVVFAKDAGGIMQNPSFFLHFLTIAGIYLVIQTGYYFFAKRKMMRQLELN